MLHCYIYCVKYRVGIDEKYAGVPHVSLSDELGFICHLAFKQGFLFFIFFHVRKMAPSELLSFRHLFIRPLPG